MIGLSIICIVINCAAMIINYRLDSYKTAIFNAFGFGFCFAWFVVELTN